MRKTALILLFSVCLLHLTLTIGLADEKTVTLVADPWQPYYGEDLPNKGFVAELITEAYKRSGYKTKYFFLPWARAINDVKAGKYDGVPTAWYNEERTKIYTYSDPYIEGPIVLFTKKEKNISWKTLEDLKPYRIGVVRGYSYSPEFTAADYLNKDESSTIHNNINKLILGRVDLIVMDKYVGLYNINKDFPEHRDNLKIIDKPLTVNKLYMMFSQTVPGIKKKTDAFNKGLADIKKDGTLDKILVKHGMK